MTDTETKAPVPPPGKLRPKNGALLPAAGEQSDHEAAETPKKPLRNKLLAAAQHIDFSETPNNLKTPPDADREKDKFKDLNFRVLVSYHQRVKGVANNWNMSMKELVEAALANWIEAHGESPRSFEELQRFKQERKAQMLAAGEIQD